MANTKKPRAMKKQPKSFSITTRVLEDFEDICSRHGIVASNKVDELISNFNKTML